MKTLKDFDFNNKIVLLRLDLNVTIKDGKILSTKKISSSLETINDLINKNAKIVIFSHLGKVKTIEDKKEKTLYPVYEELNKLLNGKVYFSSATRGNILEDKISKLNNGEVLLVENTRFEDIDGKKESSCNEELSKYWASLGDIFINDAFGLSHRKHASNYGITKFIDSGIGLLMEHEINGLKPLLEPSKPFVIIMGGAKVADKLDIIKGLLPKCDYLLTGGGIANSFLNCSFNVGKSLKDDDKKSELELLLKEYPNKIITPIDVKVLSNEKVEEKNIKDINDEDIIYDIGKNTVNLYTKYINEASIIFINGTVGMYEDERFTDGTKKILETISNASGTKIAGGGDALASIERFNIKNLDFISTGGGATLEYISKNKLNCIDDN